MPKTAVIILNWNGMKYLPDCLGTLVKQDYPKEDREFILVDNASTDESVKYAQENFPEITIIRNDKNYGFDKGNNIGIKYALEKGYEYIVLLNQDTAVDETWLRELVRAAESDKNIGGAQSLMMYHQDKEKVNSWGNQLHFLGFGFCGGNTEKLQEDFDCNIRDIDYASCTSVIFKSCVLKEIGGGFDEEYFLYHEDTDISFRVRMAGYKMVLAPRSVMYHKYEFSRSITKFYYMERNRYRILLTYFKWPTLVLNFPAFIAMECGMWLFAIKSGWAKEKFRAYAYMLNPKNLSDIFKKRRHIQKTRKLTDKEFTKNFAGEIMYQEIDNPLLRYIANPIFKIYWKIVKMIMVW
ncbi:MAG: glycosyltransferase family 2 protein [bacterium]